MEQITLGQLSGWITFVIVLVGGLGTMVGWFMKPIKNEHDKDKKIEERVKSVEEHLDNDNKRLNMLESDTKQILLSVNTLLSHSIDNNHTNELKQRKSELDEYLIKR